MRRLRRREILDPFSSYYYSPSSSLCVRETAVYTPKALTFPSFLLEEQDLSYALDFFHPKPFELFETVTDLIRVETSFCTYKNPERHLLEGLCDRISALEERFDRLVMGPKKGERKFTWTAEIKGPVERKYRWGAEIKGGKKEEDKRSYKWTAEIKGKGEDARKYTYEISNANGEKKEEEKKEKDNKEKKAGATATRLVEIEQPCVDHGVVVLRQAFSKRTRATKAGKGKHKDLSAQDAAFLIQMTFRAYIIRRSQALRALRELAIAKAKLKEIRALFNNFSYRRQVSRDAEERQRFSEKIIVLLLTVDAIEGADLMVRAAKRSMVDELEAMLDVVDPQPAGKLFSMRRRTFDMPDGVIRKDIAEGVAQVVQMLDNENI